MDEVLRGCYNNGTCVAPDVCECAEVSPLTDSAVLGFGVVGCGGIGGVLGFLRGSFHPACWHAQVLLCLIGSLRSCLPICFSVFHSINLLCSSR